MLLVGFILLLLPGLLFTGTLYGGLLLGLAGAMHVASVSDALIRRFATALDRIAFTLTCGVGLCLAVYAPLGWLVSRVATPVAVRFAIPPFERGQVLWYTRWVTPSQGDLVVFRLPRLAAGRHSIQGDWIGRVMALPGQTVAVDKNRWLVDGLASEWQPTWNPIFSQGTSWLVPLGHAFVFPDGALPTDVPLDGNLLSKIFVVPVSRITGRIYFRSLPLSQMSTF